MMRLLPLIPIAVLTGVPALVLPVPGFAAIGAVAAILCAAGAIARVRVLVTAGASLALIQYALALVITDAPSSPVGAAVVGVALVLVQDVSDFLRRFRGALITPAAWRGQARHWLATAAFGALSALALAAVPALVRIGGPPGLYPLLAAAGALAAGVGVAGAVRQRHRDALEENAAPGP